MCCKQRIRKCAEGPRTLATVKGGMEASVATRSKVAMVQSRKRKEKKKKSRTRGKGTAG